MARRTREPALRGEFKNQAIVAGSVARAVGVLRRVTGTIEPPDATAEALEDRLRELLHVELAELDLKRRKILDDAALDGDALDELEDELDLDIAFALDPVAAGGE